MSGWLDSIFGNLPPQPARPASQGAFLGASPGYQDMPNMTATFDDRRHEPADYAYWMKNFIPPDGATYSPPALGAAPSPSATLPGYDPMLSTGPTLAEGMTAEDLDYYSRSFPQNMRARRPNQAPYRPSEYGPNLPRPSSGSDLPFAGAHLPISPGEPGWTSPPSPSGPHNRQGDPARPGYDSPVLPLDAASQPSFQQLLDAFRAWRG